MTVDDQLQANRQYWADLLTAMSEGHPAGIESLRAMDTIEFYYFYKSWRKRIEALSKPLKAGSTNK